MSSSVEFMLGFVSQNMSTKTYQVGLMSAKIIGAVSGIFFLACGVLAFISQAYGTLPVFGFFTLLGLYLLLGSGNFEISEEAISQRNIFGHFRILWHEIQKVEMGAQGTIVLHGENKRFVLSAPTFWSGQQKPEAFEFFRTKMEGLGVIFYPSNVADYKIHKNVRVRDAVA